MKKSFSLFELIIVLTVIIVLFTFISSNYKNIFESSNLTKLKNDVSLIRLNISKKISENILLSKSEEVFLDEAKIDVKNEKLFSNILDFNILSTNSTDIKTSFWIKESESIYAFVLSKNEILKFEFKDNKFLCISKNEICGEIN